MALFLRMTEACLLVAMGTFMAMLSQSSAYWQFINPKYSWLTLTSGIVLVIIGFCCLVHAQRRRKFSELVGIAVFLVLAWTALGTFRNMGEFEGGGGTLTTEYAPEGAMIIDVDGREYVKINVVELLMGEIEGFVSAGQEYAIQGALVRSPELDQAGYVAVGRLLITCCFADSTAAVSLVKVDDPTLYEAGSWVRVLGTVQEEVPFPGKTITLTGSLTGTRSERFILQAQEVEKHPVEGVPFIFEIRGEAPFAY